LPPGSDAVIASLVESKADEEGMPYAAQCGNVQNIFMREKNYKTLSPRSNLNPAVGIAKSSRITIPNQEKSGQSPDSGSIHTEALPSARPPWLGQCKQVRTGVSGHGSAGFAGFVNCGSSNSSYVWQRTEQASVVPDNIPIINGKPAVSGGEKQRMAIWNPGL